ncbi:MAG: caspase family protein [Rhodocyclaceae bacterium]|nr:caspase family protein [Rhodocyclaceae bacterium]
MVRPPAFIGGIPGMAQFQAIQMQRHQARTLLYREALEELRKNPAAADVPECRPDGTPGAALCLHRPAAVSQQPAATAEAVTPITTPKEGRRFAVLVGNNDYKMPIPGLETPIADVSKTADILTSRFGFETRVLKNASKAQIVEALNRVAAEATPEDNVLLFYAGHGYLMDDTKMGFWIPIDASVKTAANWISNTDISKLLSAIRARQLILVSDSCFSGSLTREQKVTYSGKPKAEEVLRRRSVLVLSSGGDEPVSDEGKDGHSIFAYNLIKTLDAASGTTPGYEVWRTVHGSVSKEYSQEPQYGAVVSAGHAEGGEYLFQSR